MSVPCDCCPTSAPRCALVGVRFTGVAETVAAAGWNQVSLPLTIDGITATTALSGYNSPGGVAPTPTPEVTYTHTTPQDRVRGLRLWNQAGGDHSDFDGLGPFTADFYAGATLLTTLNAAGVNGGQAQSFLLAGGVELDGVDRVVLRNLGKLSGSSIAPLWRELQLIELQTVFPCRRRTGALQWYDQAGNLVAVADIVPCPAAPAAVPLIVQDLAVNGVAFDYIGEPGNTVNADEVLTVSPIAASTKTGTVFQAPNHYRASNGSAPTSCGGRDIGLTYQPASSFDLTYQTIIPGSPVGGVYIQFSAPSLGGALNFGLFAPGSWVPGQTKTLAVPGGVARLTYVGGPANANAPRGVGPQCNLGAAGTHLIGLHLANTSTGDQPIRFNLSFATG